MFNRSGVPVTKYFSYQVRGMATEKQILMRIGSTKNISKITKSMKMVSAAKMRGAETRLLNGRPFAGWLDRIDSKVRVIDVDGHVPKEELEEGGKDGHAIVVISSDRGLCGGINSGIAKQTRRQLALAPNDGHNTSLFIIGEKARALLRREFADRIRGNVTETYQHPFNFSIASALAQAILSSAVADTERIHVLFNKFVSAVLYQPSIRSLSVRLDTDKLDQYELEPDTKEDILADLKEFELASAIYHGVIENSTSEESSRMAAMENATTNAQDLISSLTLSYNKARQTRITTELIEIISGASSLDG
ncbi:hypothetical protein ABG067_003432 [Albugo candida]